MVYYRYLFLHAEDLTTNEGLVYSELLFHSISSNEKYRTGELIYIEELKKEIGNYKMFQWQEEIEYFSLDTKELMKRTEMTFPTIKKILTSLNEKKYINGGYIKCPYDLLVEGYIKVPKCTALKGRRLVFYAYLLDRSKKYKGIIDTWACRFKELCGIDADDVYFMIKKLKKKGFVERLKDGKLKINSLTGKNKKEETFTASPL